MNVSGNVRSLSKDELLTLKNKKVVVDTEYYGKPVSIGFAMEISQE